MLSVKTKELKHEFVAIPGRVTQFVYLLFAWAYRPTAQR